uniref:Uncharacterized protein n=1 Tax=Neogobius melanostomus TaxID=47308 RepID=A0A8C6SCQ5_9GOBI
MHVPLWLNHRLNGQLSGKSRNPPTLHDGDVSCISRSFVFVRRRERGKRLTAKQQEGRAMATLARQIPSPDTFLCQPWSSFVSAVQLSFFDSKFARRWLFSRTKYVVRLPLPLADMLVRSQFPVLEDFCLVVCHVCDQVVTPRGILKHHGKTNTSKPTNSIILQLQKQHQCVP